MTKLHPMALVAFRKTTESPFIPLSILAAEIAPKRVNAVLHNRRSILSSQTG
jgi:hypothetical protein